MRSLFRNALLWVLFFSLTLSGCTRQDMSQQDLERAFDRFYRADAVRSGSTGGTGLGLAIARWITGKHGGRYEIISMEGLGSRFHVEFPGTAGSAPGGAWQREQRTTEST